MPNTRMVGSLVNFARAASTASPFPKIVNGNGAYIGAPSRVEVAGFPMENFLSGSRLTPWVIPAGATNVGTDLVVEVDLGAVKTIALCCTIGTEKPTPFPSSYILLRNASPVYNAAGYTSIDTITIGAPDGGKPVVPFTARYIQLVFTFAFSASADWSPGFLFLSNITSSNDIGANPSYGAADHYESAVAVSRSLDGTPYRVFLGSNRRRWTLPFRSISTASKDKLVAALTQQSPVLYVNHEDKVFEVSPVPSTLTCEQVFLDLWNVSVELEQS